MHRSRLPEPLTSFVGRDRERAAVSALLRQPNVRLVSLTGAGGAGKTRLAIRVAQDLTDAFDRIWFVPLSAVSQPELLLSAICKALGLRETREDRLEDRLVSALSDQSALMLLDNFEQIVHAAPRLTSLLERVPSLRALVTTRLVLNVSGEFAYPVPPLALPPRDTAQTPEALMGYAPVRLFVERAKAVDPAFTLTEANAADVTEICRMVDGLPLGIELAAARLRTFSPESLRGHLVSRLAMLIDGPQDQPARLRSMRDAISWSYGLLTPELQALFRCISVFSDGFSERALQEVCLPGNAPAGGTIQPLESLIESSLVFRSDAHDGDQRFAMLETVQEFARESLEAAGEAGDVAERHARHYLSLAESAESRLIVVGSAAWVQRLARERANLQDAISWALQNDQPELVLRLAGTLLSMAYARGEPAESLSWLRRALEQQRGAPPQMVADALFTASALAQVQGDLDGSNALCEESREVARAAGYRFGEARALIGLGIGAEWSADLRLASEHYEAASLIMQQEEHATRLSHWRILPLANLADIALVERRPSEAIQLGRQAVDQWRRDGYLWGIAQALGTVAAARCDRGDLAGARDDYHEALDLWLACADGRGIAGTIAGIAGLAIAAGRIEQGARLLGAAESVRRQLEVQFVAHHLYAQRQIEIARERLDEQTFVERWEEGSSLSVDAAIELARTALEALPGTTSHRTGDGLSQRELEVLRQIARGMPDREIAESLSISPRTVQSHVLSILTKLNARSRAEAVAIAVRQGLV